MKKLYKISFTKYFFEEERRGGEGGEGNFWGAIFRGTIFLGALFPVGNFPGRHFSQGHFSEGIFPGGILPSTFDTSSNYP